MYDGYVRLYRKTLKSDLWQYPNACRIFQFLLLRSMFRPHKHFVGGRCIDLLPGQFISSERVIARECLIGYQATRTALEYLKSTQRITQVITRHYSVYSITKWSEYQNLDGSNNAQHSADDNAQVTHGQRTGNAQVTQEVEFKKVKKVIKDQNHTPSAAEIAAVTIVEYYEKEIRDERASRYRARKNVQALLKNGCTKEVLWECVNLYAAEADGKDPQFRKVAGNFFGRDAVYQNYIDEARRKVEVIYAAEG